MRVRLGAIARLALDSGSVLHGHRVNWTDDVAGARPASDSDHESGAIARTDQSVRGSRRAMEVIPPLQRLFFTFDNQ